MVTLKYNSIFIAALIMNNTSWIYAHWIFQVPTPGKQTVICLTLILYFYSINVFLAEYM